MKNVIIYSFLLVLLTYCKKDNVNTSPQIKYLSISATEIKQYKDSIEIVIEYVDNDGDIGEENPDENAIYVKDRRLANPDYYFVAPISPPNKKIKVKGNLVIKIKNTFLLGVALKETTHFEIKLKDREGHWSNTIITPEITINK